MPFAQVIPESGAARTRYTRPLAPAWSAEFYISTAGLPLTLSLSPEYGSTELAEVRGEGTSKEEPSPLPSPGVPGEGVRVLASSHAMAPQLIVSIGENRCSSVAGSVFSLVTRTEGDRGGATR